MSKNLEQNVVNLENKILDLENKILEYSEMQQEHKVKKTTEELRSDLKYLVILTNGVEIDAEEYRKIMDFLRVHYNFLQKKLPYSNTLP